MSKKDKTSQMSNFGEDREQCMFRYIESHHPVNNYLCLTDNNVEDSQRSMIPTSTPSLIEGGTNITTSSIPEVALLQADIERQRLRLIEIERNEERYGEIMREVVSLRRMVNTLMSERDSQNPFSDHAGPPSYRSGESSES